MGFIFHNKTFHVVNGYQLMKRQYVLKGTAPVLQNTYSMYLCNVYVLYRYHRYYRYLYHQYYNVEFLVHW